MSFTLTEKKLMLIETRAFTANGTSLGKITIADTAPFKVKQHVVIKSSTQPNLTLEIKRISSRTELQVGPIKGPINRYTDMTLYTLADGSSIEANEQNRPSVPEQEIERLTYEEEPTIARRVVMVDKYGDKWHSDNPLPVRIQDAKIEANLHVQLSHQDDDPLAGDIHDSIRIGDGTDLLEVNPNGSINVNITGLKGGEVVNSYNEVSSIPSAALTDIAVYTIPVGKTATLEKVQFSGCNIATYHVEINGNKEAKFRTWFNGPMSSEFDFATLDAGGILLAAGDVVKLRVIHNRPTVGDFEGRIQVVLK